MGNGAGEGQRNGLTNPRVATRRGGIVGSVAAALMAASAGAWGQAAQVVSLCTVDVETGWQQCFDTMFAARDYVDCPDDAAALAIGSADRGGGFIRWGNDTPAGFQVEGEARYEWSGRQVIAMPLVRAMIGVDHDRIFGADFADGADRPCRSGRFMP
jgi:hypothetical protein